MFSAIKSALTFTPAASPFKSQPSHLVVGCGHNNGCTKQHKSEQFVTIDIETNVLPDHVCDARDIGTLRTLFPEPMAFKAIIYEFSWYNSEPNPLHLSPLLAPNGHIVILGHTLDEVLLSLESNHYFWYFPQAYVYIFSSDCSQLILDPTLTEYLQSYLKVSDVEKTACFGLMTDQLRTRCQRVREFFALSKDVNPLNSDHPPYLERLHDEYANALCMATPSLDSPTLNDIADIVADYKPGFLRQRSQLGMTQGMADLKKELSILKSKMKDSDPLTINDLLQLLGVMIGREARVKSQSLKDYNPTRATHGSTSQVFERLAGLILNYLVSNDDVYTEIVARYLAIEKETKKLTP